MIPTEPGDLLERSLDVLERSLAMESALSRLAEGQEELRRMIMAMVNGNDVPEMIPAAFVKREEGDEIDVPGMTPVMTGGTVHPTNDPTASVKSKERKNENTPVVKDEEGKDDEIEMIELPSATAATQLRVKSAEEDDDISSVSSVSTDENVDYMELSSDHDLEGEEGIQENDLAKESEDEEDEGCSTSSGGLDSNYEIESDCDAGDSDEDRMAEVSTQCTEDPSLECSKNTSAPNRTNYEKLSNWKCVACKKMVKGAWQCRQYHIESHEELKLSCPVEGCSARRSSHNFVRHLRIVHKTTRNSLPVEQRAELQRQQKEINQKAIECEKKYFPPSSLVSFAETAGKIAVNPACKKCGKIYAVLLMRRDHVGSHLNRKIQCPFLGCKHAGSVESIRLHLLRVHKKTLTKLTVEERDRFEKARSKFNEDVEAAMQDFFPEVLQTEKRSTEVKSPFCNKCGKRALELVQRRDHVATHVKAKIPSEVGKNLQKLAKEQRRLFEESRRKFCEQVDAVMEEYFS